MMESDRDRLDAAVRRATELAPSAALRSLRPWFMLLKAGVHALDRRFEAARDELLAALEEPLVTERSVGFYVLADLARVEYALGNLTGAVTICRDLGVAMQRRKAVGYEVYAHVHCAAYNLLLGQTEPADVFARQALIAARGFNATVVTCAVEILGAIAALRGRHTRAARLLGYVDAWFSREEHIYVNIPVACREMLRSLVDANLPAAMRDRHVAAGASISEDTAIAEALADVPASPS
jgi:hypothetical protein